MPYGSGVLYSANRPEIGYPISDDALTRWRLCTNFLTVQGVLERFGEWPDNLLDHDDLEPLFKGEWTQPVSGLAVAEGDRVKALFPYLDEVEAEKVVKVYEAAKPRVYPDFAAFLEKVKGEPHCGAEGMLLPAQTLLVLCMRGKEREAGIWDMRTPEQRLGTVFALGVHIPGTFSRVSALVSGRGMRLCVPWGGAYGEYCKILPLLEHPHAGWLLNTADEELNVFLGGLASRPLELIEFLDVSKLHLRRGQARLNVDALPASSVFPHVPALRSAMRKVAGGATECMHDLLDLWRTGQYSYLDGPGDYLEMTYSVLLGLLFSWAMDDGLLKRPPSFVRSGEPLVPKKSTWAAIARIKPHFTGICMLRDADSLWDALVGVDSALAAGDDV